MAVHLKLFFLYTAIMNRWLQYVDQQLSPSVELLKLGLHSDLRHYYSEAEKLDKPSQLFSLLLEKRQTQSESEVLRRFRHVIAGLGGKLRGSLVIREGFGRHSQYQLEDPGPFDVENASKEFKFFQCLLKIMIRAEQDVALCNKFKRKFSRRLNTNYRQFRHLPELFIQLYQGGIISPDDTQLLEDTLIKQRASECLLLLSDYYESVGRSGISQAQGFKQRSTG